MQANALPSGSFRPSRPASDFVRRALTEIATFVSAVGDGIQNAHDYKTLVNQGIAPRDAARKVFETIAR